MSPHLRKPRRNVSSQHSRGCHAHWWTRHILCTYYTNAYARLDRLYHIFSGKHTAGSSHMHMDYILRAKLIRANNDLAEQLQRLWQEHQLKNACLVGIQFARGPCTSIPHLASWLASKHLHVSSANDNEHVREAQEQEALDLSLSLSYTAATLAPDDKTARHWNDEHTRPKNGNWYWDQQSEPRCPTTSLSVYDANKSASLTDAARLLLSEWPIGTSTDSYTYRPAYRGLDFDTGAALNSTPSGRFASASKIVRPSIGRSNKPGKHSRQNDEPTSSPIYSSMQPSQPPPSQDGVVQTQLEPGRYARRRSIAAQPRKKRLGGF